ncbi:MAG: 50S ribosomal protein L18 [Deltaproteobacteria bacterium]|nr:50S ribosomal protein L18 [Deltaproteobacteria bacterium]
MAKTSPKLTARIKRVQRIRTKISGTADKPRMRVFRSNRHIYAQIIDDIKQTTLVAMSTLDKEFDGSEIKDKCDAAKKVGELLARRAKSAGINQVVFDRGGNLYHGRIKALSDGARAGGLDF